MTDEEKKDDTIHPTLRKWYDDDQEYDYRYAFNLSSESVVFDIGGYDGYWTQNIAERYDAYVYLFEPVQEFFNLASNSLCVYNKVKTFNYGVGKLNTNATMYLQKDGSNLFVKNDPDGNSETVEIKSISDILYELKINKIDLLKINAEGSEYDILECLIEKDLINVVNVILVQFHEFVESALDRKQKIEQALHQTHNLVFDYDFIWQKWEKKN